MRFLAVTSIFLSQLAVSQGHSKCLVYVPKKEFYNSDHVITFDFTTMFSAKNYTEVYSPDIADFVLKLEGIEQRGRFHHALAVLEMGPYKAHESVICYTQMCGVRDYVKAFNRSYKKLSSLIPACR